MVKTTTSNREREREKERKIILNFFSEDF